MDTNSAVAHRLHVAYKNSGMSFLQIAEKTGLPISAIRRIITGQNQKIDIDRMKMIAEALGVSPSFVMGWDVPDRNEYKLPLLGSIACGSPTFAEENFEGYIIFPNPSRLILLCGQEVTAWSERESLTVTSCLFAVSRMWRMAKSQPCGSATKRR